MFKKLATVICLLKITDSAPSYNYNTFSSTPSYMMKQSFNVDPAAKYGAGYKVQDTPKVKKEYTDYQSRPNFDYNSFEDYSTTAAPLSFPYQGQKPTLPQKPESKLFFHHHHDPKSQFLHDVAGHFITDVAGHKLKHVGEVLESGVLTEPIIHKLSFAKAALLQLLAIVGPLSAIKTVHVLAKASDPHGPHHEHEGEPLPPFVPLPAEHFEHVEPHSHHPPTVVGLLLHFVAQLSKFTTEAKLHLIPNLLKMVSYASSSSSHVSHGAAHHH